MQKELKAKLEKLSINELVNILDVLCETPEFEKSLKLLIKPTKSDIERALNSFERWCNSFGNNPCSEKAEKGVLSTSVTLLNSLAFVDIKTATDIVYKMYAITSEITEYSDAIVDANCEYRYLLENYLENNESIFSEGELKKYKYIIDIYD